MADKHPLYSIWKNMKSRCYNPNRVAYKDYGGRGISVCDRWRHSFMSFYEDMLEGYEEGLSLDREDNDGNYCKENCRWINRAMQNRNQRKSLKLLYKGKYVTEAELSEITGIPRTTIQQRRRAGWEGEDLYKPAKLPELFTFEGKEVTLKALSEKVGINTSTLRNRIKRAGLSVEEAVYGYSEV